MKNNYVLIDFENVQPKNLEILKGHEFIVKVFVGSKQTKVPIELATALQAFGEKAEYIQIEGNGRNALDFHIAYYIGHLAASDPEAFFHVISKDTGFDPLIRHLKAKKIRAYREKDIAEIPILKISNSKSDTERIDAIIVSLKSRGTSKPRKVKTLSNTINSLFMKKLCEAELQELIDALKKRKAIAINDTNVSYNLPA
jgi:hypothetical protein